MPSMNKVIIRNTELYLHQSSQYSSEVWHEEANVKKKKEMKNIANYANYYSHKEAYKFLNNLHTVMEQTHT